jgi:hypothetical protein
MSAEERKGKRGKQEHKSNRQKQEAKGKGREKR